jgi:hypothetical protein
LVVAGDNEQLPALQFFGMAATSRCKNYDAVKFAWLGANICISNGISSQTASDR